MSRTGNELRDPGGSRRRAAIALAAAAAMLLTAAAPGLHAQPASATAPATAPTTDPIDTIPTSPARAAPQPIRPARTTEEALAYTDKERTAFGDVRDGDGQLDGVALSILLRRAAMLPTGRDIRQDADRPSPPNLWRRPADYRARFIAVEGLYSGRMDMSNSVAPTPLYAGPVYAVVLTEDFTGEGRPILVVMSEEPPQLRERTRVSVAGLFYKVVRLPVGDGGDQTADYAVVVTRGLCRPGAGAGFDIPLPMKILGAVIVTLLVLFLVVWRRARSGATRKSEYKPLRFEGAAEGAAGRPNEAKETEESGEVDEDLIRQVEEFRRRKRGQAGDE